MELLLYPLFHTIRGYPGEINHIEDWESRYAFGGMGVETVSGSA